MKMTLVYRRTYTNGDLVKEMKTISSGSQFSLRLPFDTDLSSAYLALHAIGGTNIITTKIETNTNCILFNIWGTTLLPQYSKLPC